MRRTGHHDGRMWCTLLSMYRCCALCWPARHRHCVDLQRMAHSRTEICWCNPRVLQTCVCYYLLLDVQVYSTPLVGVWVKGPSSVVHPLVAAACLRFAHSSLLADRAVNPDSGAFLLLLCPEGMMHLQPPDTRAARSQQGHNKNEACHMVAVESNNGKTSVEPAAMAYRQLASAVLLCPR